MIKKIFYIISFCLLPQTLFAAGEGGGSSSEPVLYKEAERLVNRAKKLDEKGQVDKALNLYVNANSKLIEANNKDQNNPDILNYLGFTFRKMQKYDEAEKYYLAGLSIKPDHNGINEYLGELYVKTNRIDLAKERLEVLRKCNCEEFEELKVIIDKL